MILCYSETNINALAIKTLLVLFEIKITVLEVLSILMCSKLKIHNS